MNMTALHKHIAVLLVLAVFGLMMHVGVYHGLDVVDDYAQEQEHDHVDSDTCVASLAHAQVSVGQQTPMVEWFHIAILPAIDLVGYRQEVRSVNPGRAPPNIIHYHHYLM